MTAPKATVRRADPGDAAALTDLHLDVWDEAYGGLVDPAVLAARRATRAARVQRWRQTIESGNSTVYVAEPADPGDSVADGDPAAGGAAGRLLGFAHCGPRRDADASLPRRELMALYVRAEVYGVGLGYALLRTAIGDSPAYAWVLDGNERAIRFYQRQGFAFDGSTKHETFGVERRMVRR